MSLKDLVSNIVINQVREVCGVRGLSLMKASAWDKSGGCSEAVRYFSLQQGCLLLFVLASPRWPCKVPCSLMPFPHNAWPMQEEEAEGGGPVPAGAPSRLVRYSSAKSSAAGSIRNRYQYANASGSNSGYPSGGGAAAYPQVQPLYASVGPQAHGVQYVAYVHPSGAHASPVHVQQYGSPHGQAQYNHPPQIPHHSPQQHQGSPGEQRAYGGRGSTSMPSHMPMQAGHASGASATPSKAQPGAEEGPLGAPQPQHPPRSSSDFPPIRPAGSAPQPHPPPPPE